MGTAPQMFEDGEQRGLGLGAFIVDPSAALAASQAEVRALREALEESRRHAYDEQLAGDYIREVTTRALAPGPPE